MSIDDELQASRRPWPIDTAAAEFSVSIRRLARGQAAYGGPCKAGALDAGGLSLRVVEFPHRKDGYRLGLLIAVDFAGASLVRLAPSTNW